LRQALVSDYSSAGVSAAFRFAGAGGEAAGALIGGMLAAAFGVRAPLVVGAPVLVSS
jgi:predicted MFS family arabinose efflux permease